MDRLTSNIKYKNGRRLKGCWEATTASGAGVIYAAIDRLAAYEDTGLTPGDVKDLQALCKENGLAKYVDLIVEAKRQMGISNERDIEQNERIEELEAENARLRAELAEQQRETASCDYLLGEADVGARVAGGEIKELRSRLELAERERDKAVEEINLVFGRVRALADCDGYHPYENVCDLCAFFDGGEKRECHGNCKNARWCGTEGKRDE